MSSHKPTGRQAIIQAEALANATQGDSLANFPAIYAGFMARGIPETDIQPRENIFTFNAWKALGRVVKRGEHGVRVQTFVPMTKKTRDDDGTETPQSYEMKAYSDDTDFTSDDGLSQVDTATATGIIYNFVADGTTTRVGINKSGGIFLADDGGGDGCGEPGADSRDAGNVGALLAIRIGTTGNDVFNLLLGQLRHLARNMSQALSQQVIRPRQVERSSV